MVDVCSRCGKSVSRNKRSRPEIVCRDCRALDGPPKSRPQTGKVKVVRVVACRWCRNLFRAVSPRAVHCSDKCRSASSYAARQKPADVHADCSGDCDNKKHVPCAGGCGNGVWLGSSGSAASPTCRKCRAADTVAAGGVYMDGQWRYQRTCQVCATEFLGQNRRAKFCSKECFANARRVHATPRQRDYVKTLARRARKKAVYVEDVVPAVVFERDNWTCYLCDQPVDKSLSGRHQMGPTVDHVVPISLGGPHSYANVRLAHFSCNSRKSDHYTGQIPLPI